MLHTSLPHPAAVPVTALLSLGTLRPRIFLRHEGTPLMSLTPEVRNMGLTGAGVNDLIQHSLDSLQDLQATGQPRHYLALQGVVCAMLELQRMDAIHIDTAAIMKGYDALSTIQARHYDALSGTWSHIRMTAPEMANIENAIHHHGAQLLNSSRGEVIDAIKASTNWTQAQADAIVAKVRCMN
ncbi:hypothetical protein CCO03_17140 [Comamonas serinivorans]|uniref:Uncharacterized protein n=1 Tax=Comamonas serinivorans TaxID=1082851 RepID=A0A1Y0ERX0_9BURK|nr:hypothetical protein [Comamonas serinivorans]ARU06170.1 hypothetical protein CCO03_17140 [Comamonas serinivorans]